jgi:predicted  nucleic acid-binding Zn-ribbon protein
MFARKIIYHMLEEMIVRGCCVCRNQKFIYTCLKDDTMDAREREFDSFN